MSEPRTEHTQDCINAFYADGGQSGCICGADERAEHDALPTVGPETQAALDRIFQREAATPPLDALARKIADRISTRYRADPAGIAAVLDEDVDRSGNLLGWLRDYARLAQQDGTGE